VERGTTATHYRIHAMILLLLSIEKGRCNPISLVIGILCAQVAGERLLDCKAADAEID
jgi:hypothetical protein